jgi:hypothetical protein
MEVGEIIQHVKGRMWRYIELLDQESRRGVEDGDFSSSVLALKLNHNLDSSHLRGFLLDIFSDLLGVL